MKRTALLLLAAPFFLTAQATVPERAPTARPVLGWRLGIAAYTFRNFTLFEAIEKARAAGLRNIEGFDGQKISAGIPKPLNPDLTAEERAALREKLRTAGVAMPTWYHHKFAATDESCRRVFEFAKSLGIETIVGEPDPEGLTLIDKYAQEYGVNLAIHNHSRDISPVYWDPKNTVRLLEGRSKRIGMAVDLAFWAVEGLDPVASLGIVKDRLMALHLKDAKEANRNLRDVPTGAGISRIEDVLKEVYRLDLKPALTIEYSGMPDSPDAGVWQSAAFVEEALQRLVAERVESMSQTTATRRKISPADADKVAAALPASAPAKPRKPRKLLVLDMQVAYGGHRSIPHANLAIELMGKKTGAFSPTFSNDLSNLRWEQLRQYDALYLNNTVGPLFNSPGIRESILRFVREGGGLAGNHGATHASLDWPDFAELFGGRNGPHRDANEKVTVKLDDPASPINAAFQGQPFTFTDEYFRFPTAPYSRDKLHVLISFDVAKTDMNQGRACDACIRADNDYAVSWIREYGKGRVFYCSLGHNPDVFFTPGLVAHFLAGIQYALGDLDADATPSARLGRTLQEMEPVLASIARFEDGQEHAPLADFTNFVDDSSGSPTRRTALEQRLLRFVQSPATHAGKDFVLRHLSVIGSDAAVPVLAGMLADKQLGEMALYALARIPGAASSAALRRAVTRLSGNTKIAAINSLGQRRDAQAVPVLAGLLKSKDARVAGAAANSLARIGSGAALSSLGSPARFPEAYLLCAEQVASGSEKHTAAAAFKSLLGANQPEMIRVRALAGYAAAAGNGALPALIAELESKTPKVQFAAIRLLNEVPGAEATGVLVRAYPKLTPTAQVRLLGALARRGDAAARPLFPEAANSPSAQVRIAALEGLAQIGDSSSLQLLAEAAANRSGREQEAARTSLYRIRGKEIDSALIAAMAGATGKVQAELIAAAGERGISAASGPLLKAAHSDDREVRRQALRALRNTGGPQDVPAILELLTGAPDSSERRDAARALISAIREPDPDHLRAILAAYQSAPAVEVRTALLEVMGQAPGSEALPVLRKSLEDSNPDISRAAVLALSNWSNPAPMPDLLRLAKDSGNPTLQVLAIRGYIRLAAIPSGRRDPETVKLFAEAMQLATRPDEKRTVLALLPSFNCVEALELARSYVNDPALEKEARTAVMRLTDTLKPR